MGLILQQLFSRVKFMRQAGVDSRPVAKLLVALLLPGALVVGCSLESPKAPQWNVNITVPLADRHYDIPYIIEHADQPELVWDSVSGARFEVQRTLDTVFVGDNITFGATLHSYYDSLGLIRIHTTESLNEEIQLTEMYAGPSGDIPEFAAQLQREFQPLSEVQHAEITEGTLRLGVENSLGLTITHLQIDITDIATSTPLGQAVFTNPIPPAAVAEADIDLAGQTIGDRLQMTVYLQSAGGYLEATEGLSLEISAYFPDSLEVSQATAMVPPVSRLFSDIVDFSNDIQASAAVFQGGQLAVGITNGCRLDADVVVRFPDLSRHGAPVALTGFLGSGLSEQLVLDLENISYVNSEPGATRLRVEFEIQTPGSSSPVEVDATDRFEITAIVDSPIIESFTGILPRTRQTVSGLNTEIDLPDGFEDVGLAAAEIQVEVLSSLPFPGEYSLGLTGDRAQSLSIEGELLPAIGGIPIASAVNIADASSLLQPIPATITAAGTVYYGDGITEGTAHATDYLVPSFTLIAPLSVSLDGVRYDGETEGVELSGESDDLAGRLGAATVTAEFENLLPFGVTIEVRLADRRGDLPDNADVVLGPAEILPAAIDATGRSIQAQVSQDVFTVSAEQAHIFEADSVFITEQIEFYTADGAVVTVQDRDYIHWRALLQIETSLGARD